MSPVRLDAATKHSNPLHDTDGTWIEYSAESKMRMLEVIAHQPEKCCPVLKSMVAVEMLILTEERDWAGSLVTSLPIS